MNSSDSPFFTTLYSSPLKQALFLRPKLSFSPLFNKMLSHRHHSLPIDQRLKVGVSYHPDCATIHIPHLECIEIE